MPIPTADAVAGIIQTETDCNPITYSDTVSIGKNSPLTVPPFVISGLGGLMKRKSLVPGPSNQPRPTKNP